MASLRRDLNWSTLWALPEWSSGPRGKSGAVLDSVRAAGYVGIQYPDAKLAIAHGLRATGMAQVLSPDQIMPLAQSHAQQGFDCTTLNVGTGLETDAQMDALAVAVLEATHATGHTLYLETHRATMTQDMRRTVDLVARHPDLRFTADLSHWYTGHEMIYGDFAAKLDFIDPVLARVGFIHGRIGNSCCMQVVVDANGGTHVDHFVAMWRRCFDGFLKTAADGDQIIFSPELLPARLDHGGHRHDFNYARQFDDGSGTMREESDRWEQATLLWEIAAATFEEAATAHQARHGAIA
jgi:hypothetical protein